MFSPPGYDLASPQKFVMGEVLHEISGIVFLKGNPDTMYAIEDEAGKLFHFHLGDRSFPYWKFGKHGDYEDVAILDDKEFVVLRSDGSLFCPSQRTGREGGGRDEGLRAYTPDRRIRRAVCGRGGRLIALCKNCPDDDQREEVTAYVLQYNARRELAVTDHFLIEAKASKLRSSDHKKVKFHPSALARHPLTKEWFILSSVNKALLVLDGQVEAEEDLSAGPHPFQAAGGACFRQQGKYVYQQ
ncbi:hypothetical protein ACQ86N_06440 [Puia sp. P3]|uniref:hypothetical protein n=1 Tax=Puia sp. P3 TaxID=3423952 RepID=UPI003D677378